MKSLILVSVLGLMSATALAQVGPVRPARAEDKPVTISYSPEQRNWVSSRGPLYPVTESAYDVMAALDKSQSYNCIIPKSINKGNGSWGGMETRDYLVLSINCGN